jgi:glycosyltransferase involved in cell wall biosynthesis
MRKNRPIYEGKVFIFLPISTKVLFTKKRRAVVSVINDLVTDNRVLKTCKALVEEGYEVTLIGRITPNSPPVPAWNFRTKRFRMVFSSGPLFYFFFNVRLFFRLLVSKADLYYANDLDTLLPNYIVSRLKRVPLIYDSHELFCEVPELQHSPLKKQIWENLEKFIVPKLTHCITVNDSIAGEFKKKHGVHFSVVRNIGEYPPGLAGEDKLQGLPAGKKLVILQGSGINVDRGAEELVLAMKSVPSAALLIIGGGDVWEKLEELVRQNRLDEKVIMIRRIPRDRLLAYTRAAALGISIDKPSNLNYLYSLPNKIFDYIHCGVPVLATRLPELERIINTYGVGEFIDSHEPAHIAQRINALLGSEGIATYRRNCQRAAESLSWQEERKVLRNVIQAAVKSSQIGKANPSQ